MGGAYGTRGREEKCRQMIWEKVKKMGLLEDIILLWRTILKWT